MLMKADAVYQEIPTPQIVVNGRFLAHNKRPAPERALVGAALVLNTAKLVSPTVKQAAALARVSVPYVAAGVAIADDQAAIEAVLAGDCAILDAAKASASETLAEHFARATPDEWLEVARTVGPSVVWDRMISPLV